MKKAFSVLITVLILVCSLPISAFAEEILLEEVVAPEYQASSSATTLSTIDEKALSKYL